MPTNAAATGYWSAQNANNARQGRALVQGMFVGAANTAPLSAVRSGVISTVSDGTYAYDLRVTVSSGLTMTVQPGTAIINRPGQGAYEAWVVPPAVNVTCDPAPASNPRNDIVVLRVYDPALGDTAPSSGANIAQVEIITGTPGAIPADPVTWDATGTITSFPTTGGGVGIPLARAQVSTGGVITLTDIRRGTAPIGGTRVLLPGDLLSDPSYMPGDISWYNGLRYWDGSVWHGIGSKVYSTGPMPNVSSQNTSPFTLATISIPDPGWSYRLRFTGMVEMSVNNQIALNLQALDGSNTGATLSPANTVPVDSARNSSAAYTYPLAGLSGVLTGARTVYITLTRFLGPTGNGYTVAGGSNYQIYAEVVPA